MQKLVLSAWTVTGPVRSRLPGPGALFVRSGACRIGTSRLAVGEAGYLPAGLTLDCPELGTIWLWLLTRSSPALTDRFHCEVEHSIDVGEGERLIRFDRVDFPPGGVTAKHTHAGPGLRRLLAGRLDAEIGEERFTLRPGECWLERGPDPVIGRSSHGDPASFLRLVVLPPDYRGRSSFQPWDAEEARKPNPVSYRLFFEELVSP